MKNGIPDNIYYELLEWKDKNSYTFIEFSEFISSLNDKKRPHSLNDLTTEELKLLYYSIHRKEMPMGGQSNNEEYKLSHG